MVSYNPKLPRWSNEQVKEHFGLSHRAKLPKDGHAVVVAEGIRLWIMPLMPREIRGYRKPHRVLASCPRCAEVFSAGRLAQHRCKEVGSSQEVNYG